MKNSKNQTNYYEAEYFDFQEQEDNYILNNYGVRVKNRGKNKKPQKFTQKREKELKEY